MSIIIGLTGGIGSGKSTVAAYFQKLGIPVYFADDAGRRILLEKSIIEKVASVFGEKIMDNGSISREKLASIVFSEPSQLAKLNAIIHPAVRADFLDWCELNKDASMLIKEAAILFESGADRDCDYVISVIAPDELRIKRVMERDNVSRNAVLNRIKNQWTDDMRVAKSDFVIENIYFSKTEAQIKEILKKLHNL